MHDDSDPPPSYNIATDAAHQQLMIPPPDQAPHYNTFLGDDAPRRGDWSTTTTFKIIFGVIWLAWGPLMIWILLLTKPWS
ncbi:hypothetical protein OIDMADRAFT_19765 [Oidiodendron maius Zn]|uniref:Uncharacterized protein n=1 Tax=Oidiodendron maius (strain Zn) TaxID=913774 RepID=A0A0C3HBM0_OIDMZ|nr:hypothetical protein OIDMADRAFT_19765 [Oidiodendron maius Zn]